MLFRYLTFFLFVSVGPSCLAQAVKISVINASDRHPLQNRAVSVSLLYEKGEAAPAKHDAILNLQTDRSGEVRFVLPAPPPAHIAVRVEIEWGRWHCGCAVLALTQDVIQKGIVDSAASASESRRSPNLMQAVPGEIRFVARSLSFWERLLYPLEKD
jgi:hypothetical protein